MYARGDNNIPEGLTLELEDALPDVPISHNYVLTTITGVG